ncbi:hypothetical protein JCM6882_001499 [Rhodosporidiobolus microsporus]
MLAANTARGTLRATRAAPSPFRLPVRSCATRSTLRQQALKPQWKLVGLAGTATLTLAAWEFKPEVWPSPEPLHADAPPFPGTYLDPTTKTPFPQTLTSPQDGTRLRLVGTGVRTVSILSIRVYAVGFYASERELEQAKAGKLIGWEGYTPERLIPPFSIPPGEPERPTGELLIDNLLEKADAAVVIVPLRNTSLLHLRDAFTRALVARMKIPRVVEQFTEQMNEATGAALVEFKTFFPSRSLNKGSPLELYYSAVDRSVLFQLKDPKTPEPELLGTLREPLLSKELMVSYFSDSAAPSSELRKSVAMGFAGAER